MKAGSILTDMGNIEIQLSGLLKGGWDGGWKSLCELSAAQRLQKGLSIPRQGDPPAPGHQKALT